MGESTSSREFAERAEREWVARAEAPAGTIAALTALASHAVGAERCAIAWNAGARAQILWLPDADSRWDAAIVAILAALENRIGDAMAAEREIKPESALSTVTRIALNARELASFNPGAQTPERGAQLVASALYEGHNSVRIVIAAPHDRARKELEAMLQLLGLAALTRIGHESDSATLDFWRAHAAKSVGEAQTSAHALNRERAQAEALDAAVAAASEFAPHERVLRLGALVAELAGLEQWLVAVEEADGLRIAASSDANASLDVPSVAGAVEKGWHSHAVIEASGDPFAGNCVCIPFELGVFAAASKHEDEVGRARAAAILARLAPIVKCWKLEEQGARRRILVNRLALRMFAAIDEERARIARDLHDDHAQLLAAAQIALAGKPEQARAILQQVEEELRRKTRELRPASLGDETLEVALQQRIGELQETGVAAKLHVAGVSEISRATQHLCFQIVREVLSNVSKHARATTVEVSISYEAESHLARLAIADNGHGFDASKPHDGAGLAGLHERLKLVGGNLSIESNSRGTTLTAEIPELPGMPTLD